MRHISASITIVGIWVIATVTILSRGDVSPLTVLSYAMVNTLVLALFGFRPVGHPDDKENGED